MSIRNSAQTTALLIGTGLTAAGLSLGVLGIGSDEPSSTESAEVAAEPTESVELVASRSAADPVFVATVSDVPLQTEEEGQQQAQAVPTVATVATPPVSDHDESSDSRDDSTDDHDEATDHEDDSTDDHDEATDDEDESTAEAPTTTNAPVPATQPPTTPTQKPSTTTSTTVAPTNPPATAPATEYLTYEWEGIADIIVALHNGRDLEFWSAIPAPGWVFLVEDDTSTKVKIKFRPLNGGDEAEWKLSSQDGELKLKQER